MASIQESLAPGARVTHNAMVMGRDSEVVRQVDVLVEQSVGQYGMTIAIDCKDYKTPVDVKGVEEFAGLVRDIRAHKGVLVCPAGFTTTAKKLAKKLQMELYRPADTDHHKWQVRISMPVLCDFRSTSMAFGFRMAAPLPMRLPYENRELFDMSIYDENGVRIGQLLEIASLQWNSGLYPSEPGEHSSVPLLGGQVTKIDYGYGTVAPVDLSVSLVVKRQRYIGQVPVDKLRGFQDEQTGLVITNAFQFRLLDPVEIQNQWEKVEEGSEPPYPIALHVTGLTTWGEPGLAT